MVAGRRVGDSLVLQASAEQQDNHDDLMIPNQSASLKSLMVNAIRLWALFHYSPWIAAGISSNRKSTRARVFAGINSLSG